MKTGEDHDLPLPRQAIELFKRALAWRRGGEKRDWVFPAISERQSQHMHRDTRSKAFRTTGLRHKHVPHGFRAPFRTLADRKSGESGKRVSVRVEHRGRRYSKKKKH